MAIHHCWVCRGIDRFVFKILPWMIGITLVFASGFATRHYMAKDVLITVTAHNKDGLAFETRLRLRTNQATADRDEGLEFDSVKDKWVEVNIGEIKVHAERDMNNN